MILLIRISHAVHANVIADKGDLARMVKAVSGDRHGP